MKRIFILLLVVCSLFTMVACDAETMKLAADSFNQLSGLANRGNVYKYDNCTMVIRDNANLITDEEETRIVNSLQSYCEQSKCDILLMTTKEVGLSSVSPGATYAQAYLPKDSENWITLTYDVGRNSYYLYYDGDIAKTACVGSRGDGILNVGHDYFRKDKYADGLLAMAKQALDNVVKLQDK